MSCGIGREAIRTKERAMTAEGEEMSKDCTRSHPHELMDCCCEHKTESARLANRLATANSEIAALKESRKVEMKAYDELQNAFIDLNLNLDERRERIEELEEEIAALKSELAAFKEIVPHGEPTYDELKAENAALKVSQCTSPFDDSPPCRGIQKRLDEIAALQVELAKKPVCVGYVSDGGMIILERLDGRANGLDVEIYPRGHVLARHTIYIDPPEIAQED